ncbi:MAG: ATP-binding protein [Candidatus Micrarchaeia archaeon]
MKIVILSGKGGTGKSVITSSLAVELSKEFKIVLVDADADCPNQHILFKGRIIKKEPIQASKTAILDIKKCSLCKTCINVCQFGAIKEYGKEITIDPMKCEGCGACTYVCPKNAIKLWPKINGYLIIKKTKKFSLVYGKLLPGESASGKVVFEAKKAGENISQKENSDLILIDSAAGIGCPVIASITGSNYVIGVVEPTQTSIRNLERALEVVKHFGVPYSIVMNKVGISKEFEEKIENEFGDKIIGKIPYDDNIPYLLAEGIPPVLGKGISKEKLKEFTKNVKEIIRRRFE